MQSDAASNASTAQLEASQLAMDEQQRQFDEIQKLLSPYVQAGESALTSQQALLGLGGEEAQRTAIQRLEESPQFESLIQQGEQGILSNASATGGLRGGDVQSSLAQFRPAALSSLIQDQFTNLGGIARSGQNAAAGVGTAGQQTGQNVAGLLQQQGAYQAGNILNQGQFSSNLINTAGAAAGQFAGQKFGQTQPQQSIYGPTSTNNIDTLIAGKVA
jgi:hypothetical protein